MDDAFSYTTELLLFAAADAVAITISLMTKDFILFILYFAFVLSYFFVTQICHFSVVANTFFHTFTTTTTVAAAAVALLQNRIYMRYARNLLYLGTTIFIYRTIAYEAFYYYKR